MNRLPVSFVAVEKISTTVNRAACKTELTNWTRLFALKQMFSVAVTIVFARKD